MGALFRYQPFSHWTGTCSYEMAYVSIAEAEMKAEHEVNLDAERVLRYVTTVFPISLSQLSR